VRVRHRLVDSGVAEELLDGLERHAAHHEARCKGVAQHVPAEGLDARALGRFP
jgi:hypothetical protein